MTNPQRSTVNNLQRLMVFGAVESVSLAQEVGKESIAVFYGISLGDENLLERVGVFVSRNYGEYRFNQLRRKVASYIGKRKALIEIGNRHLRVRGVETVVIRADYGLSTARQTATPATLMDWEDHMSDPYERMQASIEAVEADVSRCQDLLGELPA